MSGDKRRGRESDETERKIAYGLAVQEARRALSSAQLRPDPELVAEGWERRFIADAVRAKEAMDLYQELGYEVRAEPIRAEEMGADCEDCRLLMLLQFRTIYTRKERAEES